MSDQEQLTEVERGVLDILRINRYFPKTEIRFARRFGSLEFVYNWRAKSNLWGRFGGGWNWKLGIQAGGRTVIIELLIFSLRFAWKPQP